MQLINPGDKVYLMHLSLYKDVNTDRNHGFYWEVTVDRILKTRMYVKEFSDPFRYPGGGSLEMTRASGWHCFLSKSLDFWIINRDYDLRNMDP